MLAADKRASCGGHINVVTKIFRVGDILVGGSGDLSFVLAMIEWVREGRARDKYPEHQRDKDDWQPLLVIETDSTTSVYDRTPFPIRYEGLHTALGSGREYAYAAMYLGKTAHEAVQVACALDSGCGNGIDVLTL